MKKLSSIIFFFLLLVASAAFAVTDASIYQAEIPVNSQSDQDRNNAIRHGLEQVLIKVSGNPAILSNLNLKNLKDLTVLVEEYGYFKPDGSDQSLLKIMFNHEKIDQLLQKAQSPIWGADRALIVVWATWEATGQPPEIIDSESTNPVRNLMNLSASTRGIPLIFPTMDLTDISQMSVNDVVTMAIPTLKNAAKHYNSDRILIARITRLTTGFDVQAKLVLGENELNWNLHDPTISGILNKLINQMGDALAKRYSTVVSDNVETNVVMKVVGILHQEDFLLVKNYLKHLALVAEVDPIEINGEEVVLHLGLRGSREALMQSISAESKLVSEPDSVDAQALVYRWSP
jgi:uncharacterized protein